MARAPLSSPYIGRFAPSPSGPLHLGSLVTAMAGFLDARAYGGQWLLRIEDIDTPRVEPGADQAIMQQLLALGMQWDGQPVWQSHRLTRYRQVFNQLNDQNLIYGCACTRRELGSGPYPGTCRHGLQPGQVPRAWRLRVPAGVVSFSDRWVGHQQQNVATEVGDFIIKRADGLWAYQFAVVVDDGDHGVTDIVRGADLLDSTARQRMLAQLLKLPLPRVMHVPLMHDEAGLKLSKQNHAPPIDSSQPLPALHQAWQHLGFKRFSKVQTTADFWAQAVPQWAARFNI